jgi:Protein of unknown function (DUF3037)
MHDNHSFEYAVIRLVPQVEREEFLNVGVILYCRHHPFLQMKFTLDETRLHATFPGADIQDIQLHLQAFEHICMGDIKGGPIALLDMASRFRWLTAKRSTVVQTSDVHPGLCSDPQETLNKLHRQLVLL